MRRSTRHGLSRRADSSAIVIATTAAIAGLCGYDPAWLPFRLDKAGLYSDIIAGSFAAWHAIRHRLTVTTVTDHEQHR